MNKQEMPSMDGRLRKSISLLGNLKGKKILNAGCKGAWLENYIYDNRTDIKQMHSFDIKNYNFPNLGKKFHFVIDSVLDMKKYFGKDFDIATFFEVIEHIPKNTELVALANINKSLKIGGKLYLSTPNKSFFSNLFDPAWWLIGHRHYSINELGNYLREAGFRIVKSEIRGGFAELAFMNLFYIFKNVFRTKKFGWNFFKNRRNKDYLDKDKKGLATIFIVAKK